MKMVSREIINDKVVITAENQVKKHWWSKKTIITRKFKAQRLIVNGFWEWLELPDHLRVNDSLSFQLDAWNRVGEN